MLAEKNGEFILRISDLASRDQFELVGYDGRIQVQAISPEKNKTDQ